MNALNIDIPATPDADAGNGETVPFRLPSEDAGEIVTPASQLEREIRALPADKIEWLHAKFQEAQASGGALEHVLGVANALADVGLGLLLPGK